MPAYMVKFYEICDWDGCRVPATHEVRTTRNEPVKRCCEPHAKQTVKILNGEIPNRIVQPPKWARRSSEQVQR